MVISSPPRKGKSSWSASRPQGAPVLKVTRYEIVSSVLVSIVLALILVAISLFIMWMSTWRPNPVSLAVIEMSDAREGNEDGDPEDDFPDLDTVVDNIDVVATLDTVVTEQAVNPIETSLGPESPPNTGTGGRRLGEENGPGTGLPREKRWYIRFADQASLDEYASQLDFFKIELGVFFIGEKSMVIISNLRNAQPKINTVTATSMGKDKIHFNWSGGSRKKADLKLLEKAGVKNAASGTIFHFYPPATQTKLSQKEQAYRGRSAKQIRRTYFIVKRAGNGYEFKVTRQFTF